jgi:hypothetical protein
MKTSTRIALIAVAGAVALAAFATTAFAAPTMMGGGYGGYLMTNGTWRSAATDAPSLAQMQKLMSAYVRADGTIDIARMRGDVATGKVTPPCFGRTGKAERGTRATTPGAAARPYRSMMGGYVVPPMMGGPAY